MARSRGLAAAALLAVVLCFGVSTGPVRADSVPPGSAPEPAATGAGGARLALSGLLTLLAGAGLVLVARQGPNGPGSRRT